MELTYLFVPPEEYAAALASGAHWDEESKRWFVPSHLSEDLFERWSGQDLQEFTIASDHALVAAAHIECVACGADIEVICLFGETGVDLETGELLGEFTVSNIANMDRATALRLEPWPNFRATHEGGEGERYFANHCSYCGAVQEDYRLHAEPGDVFFAVGRAAPESVKFTRLAGRVQLSGDCSFEI